ncbi:hypothetical protein BGZ83_005876 [Gryganskiella cystojenkinii]|nr:hypothetical protein BGZ83_005876 [Gryganskiella cystojenkinii]
MATLTTATPCEESYPQPISSSAASATSVSLMPLPRSNYQPTTEPDSIINANLKNPVFQRHFALELQSAHHELSSVLAQAPLRVAQVALDQTSSQLERTKLGLMNVHGDLETTIKQQRSILDRIESAAEFLPKASTSASPSFSKVRGVGGGATAKALPITATGSFSN